MGAGYDALMILSEYWLLIWILIQLICLVIIIFLYYRVCQLEKELEKSKWELKMDRLIGGDR
jgi:hypothetical protein